MLKRPSMIHLTGFRTRDTYRTHYTRFKSGKLLAVVLHFDGDVEADMDWEAESWAECDFVVLPSP